MSRQKNSHIQLTFIFNNPNSVAEMYQILQRAAVEKVLSGASHIQSDTT